MTCNVAAEATGRVLAVRLYNMAHDEGMRNMLSFLIARDSMHQNQWLAVLNEIGGDAAFPIPNSFPQDMEEREFSYQFVATAADGSVPEGRWTQGPSIDGKGEFGVFQHKAMGQEPVLGPAPPTSGAQSEQISMAKGLEPPTYA